MTSLLKQAFEKASKLPDIVQDELAQELLEAPSQNNFAEVLERSLYLFIC